VPDRCVCGTAPASLHSHYLVERRRLTQSDADVLPASPFDAREQLLIGKLRDGGKPKIVGESK
jgi:hypothetical protein